MTDLRTPIGIFFLLIGLILGVMGITSGQRAPLESGNVNLYCGLSMLAFGSVMLWLTRHNS